MKKSTPKKRTPAKKAPARKAAPDAISKAAGSVADMDPAPPTLDKVRQGIDTVDDLLVSLLTLRGELARQAGKLKTTKTPLDPAREAAVLRRVAKASADAQSPLEKEQIKNIFREIISACRQLQEPLSVACLGPLGSFSHEASRRVFGNAVNILPKPTFADAVTAAATGAANFALVPVENTTEGVVAATLDALEKTPQVQIYGEFILPVTQHLMGKGKLKDAKHLATYSQPLGQCRKWYEAHGKHLDLIPTQSSAVAAEMAAKSNNVVAISGELAAKTYGLDILARNIHDNPNNQTRFLIISQATPPAGKGPKKTSLSFALKHEPGSLAKLLTAFSEAGVNLTFIESRPVQGVLYEYHFYVDFLGDAHAKKLQPVMKAIQKQVKTLRVLGVYPVAE